jgi:hypothetical protein
MLLLERGIALVADGAFGAGGARVVAQAVFENAEGRLFPPRIRKASTL